MTGMIHKFSQNGYYIVLDVNSGAVHVVDEVFYKMLDLVQPPFAGDCPEALYAAFPEISREEIGEYYSELRELYEAEQLYSPDYYDDLAGKMISAPVKAMCLHVAHDCNLRCRYCFASTGDFGGTRTMMPVEIGKMAIDYLIKYSGSRHNLELDFFGGEPTMNFELVKEVVRYARSLEKAHNKNFRFTITTNGILLDDDKIDFINKEMFNVVLSVDGRKEVNDRVRARVDGSGCYDSMMPKFKRLVEKRGDGQYYVRGTFTKFNKDFAEDVLHLNQEGFDQISVEPVVADPNLDYALTWDDLPEVFAEYERLAKILLERKKTGTGFNFFHFMLDLDQGPCAVKRLKGCGCGNEYVAVTPDGDVYPCHQFVGHEEWKMGSVLDLSIDEKKKEMFVHSSVLDKPECKKCWAKFYCSGGCNANNMQYARNILTPYTLACEMEKKRLECAIMIKAALDEWSTEG